MIAVKEIHWAAGFIEADGCVSSSRSTAVVQATQMQRWPLTKLKKLFGGKIYHYKKASCGRKLPDWRLHAQGAVGLMMTLYPLMSPKRKRQIKKALKKWKNGLGKGNYIR